MGVNKHNREFPAAVVLPKLQHRPETTPLRIGQINAHHSRVVMDELKQEISRKGIDIIAIQEPYVWNSTVPGLGLTTRIVTDRKTFTRIPTVNKIHTATAIINPEYTALKLEHLSNTHCVCVEITGRGYVGYIINVYFQWCEDIERYIQHLDKVLEHLKGKNIIVCGDTNAKSILWHSSCTDDRGEKLETLIAQHDLFILNKPSDTHTFSNIHGVSNIDITLASSTCYNKVTSWKIHQDCTTSDHNLITFSINETTCDATQTQDATPRYNTKRANWTKYTELLQEQIQRNELLQLSDDNMDPDAFAAELQQIITTAGNASIPKKTRFPQSAPWWTESLTHLKKEVRRARRQCQSSQGTNRADALKLQYQALRNRYTAEIRRAKNTSWREFVTKEGNSNPWGLAYKIKTDKIQAETVFESLKTDEDHTTTWTQTAHILINTLIPNDDPTDESAWHKAVREEVTIVPDTEDTPQFTTHEVRKVTNALRNGKAPGHDLIEAEMVKAAFPKLQFEITRLMNCCLSKGTFPKTWKKGIIRVLLKGQDKNRTNPKSYRPICLLPILSKVLEKLVSQRLEGILLNHQLSSNRQFGFRKGKSTEDAIVELREIVDHVPHKYAVALLFDIAGAFDNVWWPTILQKLKRRNCPRNIYRLIQDYLSHRTASIGTNRNSTVSKTVNRGCPQGSILGPSFWNLIFDDLLNILESHGFQVIAYADDLIVIIPGNSRKQIEEIANNAVKHIINWCQNHKLQLSAPKSEMILLKGFLDIKRPPTVRIQNCSMKMASVVRYLGIHFGTRLNVAPHIHYITSKSKLIFNKLSHLAKAHWGITHRNMMTLYKGVFIPIITYAAAGWSDRINACHLKLLNQAQRFALIRASRAYRTISTEALTLLTAATPIELLMLEKRAIYRLKHNKDFDIGHFSFNAQEIAPDTDETNRLRQQIRTQVLKIWQNRWEQSTKGRTTYKFITTVEARLNSDWMELTFHNMQLLSGHGLLKNYQMRINVVPSDNCYCGLKDSIEHVIYECSDLTPFRVKLQRTLQEAGLHWPCELHNLVRRETFKEFTAFATEVFRHRETKERHASRTAQSARADQPPRTLPTTTRRITRASTRQQ